MSYCIQRAPLRDYFPCADGTGNPKQWFVLDTKQESCDGLPLCVAGPFNTQREAFTAAEKEKTA